MREEQRKTFPLSDGSMLEVRCQQHPATSALDLFLSITELAGEPLANLILAVAKGGDTSALTSLLAAADTKGRVQVDMSQMDAGALGQAFSTLARGLVRQGGAQWIATNIFAHTYARDRSSGNMVPLKNITAFNSVFTGELGALMSVLLWVLGLNFGGMVGRPNPTNPAI